MIKLSASGLNGAPCKNSVKGPDGMEIFSFIPFNMRSGLRCT